jgi:beta-glucosidase
MRTSQFQRIAIVAIVLAVSVAGSISRAADSSPLYKDRTAPIDRRVADLLPRMTLDEKIQQLRCVWPNEDNLLKSDDTFDADKAGMILSTGIGEIAPLRLETAKEVTLRNDIQQYLLQKTRLGIPVIFHDEACHGALVPGATSFPVPIGIACSWDPRMIERVFTTVAGEMRARGIQQALTPIVDICRDPRWGRTDETMGEDPYLNGKLGAAMVRGLQGTATGGVAPGHIAATLKHFTGHGQPEGGINTSEADVPVRELLDAHAVSFRIAIADSKPVAVMPSYNEIDGVPSHTNTWLLQNVLRQDLHFEGLIVSDYGGIEKLADVHGVAADHKEAAYRAFQAGVQLNLPSGDAYENLGELVHDGRISVAAIDAAVKPILRLKFALGLFDDPPLDPRKAIDITKLESAKALALQAAEESIVLLKNRNNILPLAKDKYKTIAVIGPNADQCRLGSYSGEPLYKVTIFDGIRKKVGTSAQILYSEGCKITKNLPDSSMEAWSKVLIPEYPTPEEDQAEIADAVTVAQKADLVILVIGENESISREAWSKTHVGDRNSLELFGAQEALAKAMLKLGKPVVVYLMNAKPIAMPYVADHADAILEGWYAGQETGTAAANILFGDVNPSGKLTISFPSSTGNIPAYYNYKPGSRQYSFIEGNDDPLYPFGFGLSYTTFSYSAPTVSPDNITTTGSATVAVNVTNTGSVAGDEIVQLYLHEKVTSVNRPVEELKGFQRISLAPGETKTVTFTIDKQSMAFHDINMNYVVEPGEFDVMVGKSSAEVQHATLTVQAAHQ